MIHTIHTKGKRNEQERCLFCTLIFERFSYRSEVGFPVDSGYLWRCSENGGFLVLDSTIQTLLGLDLLGWVGLLGRSRRSWQPASRSTNQGKGFTAQRPLRWGVVWLGSPHKTGGTDRVDQQGLLGSELRELSALKRYRFSALLVPLWYRFGTTLAGRCHGGQGNGHH